MRRKSETRARRRSGRRELGKRTGIARKRTPGLPIGADRRQACALIDKYSV